VSTSSITLKTCGLLSIDLLSSLLTGFYSDVMPAHQEALVLLRANIDLQRYVLSAANQKLQQITQTGHCDGPNGRTAEKVFKYCTTLAKVLLSRYTDSLQLQSTEAAVQNSSLKNRTITSQSLDAVALTLVIVSSRYPLKLGHYLAALGRLWTLSSSSR